MQNIDLNKILNSELFPIVDSYLRSGKHLSVDDPTLYEFVLNNIEFFNNFYKKYKTEIIHAPEGFIYLKYLNESLFGVIRLSKFEMLIGKVLCLLSLSPNKLANQGIFNIQEVIDELFSQLDTKELTKILSLKYYNTDIDKKRIIDKVQPAISKLQKLSMVRYIKGSDFKRFYISSAIMRFAVDVRSDVEYDKVINSLDQEGEILSEKSLNTSKDLKEMDNLDDE
ncbi:MAG: chromosome partition protein MukE [Psittacicella sp.]